MLNQHLYEEMFNAQIIEFRYSGLLPYFPGRSWELEGTSYWS